MLENEPTHTSDQPTPADRPTTESSTGPSGAPAARRRAPAKKAAATDGTPAGARRRPAKKTAAAPEMTAAAPSEATSTATTSAVRAVKAAKTAKPAKMAKAAKTAKAPKKPKAGDSHDQASSEPTAQRTGIPTVLFQPPSAENAVAARPARTRRPAGSAAGTDSIDGAATAAEPSARSDSSGDEADGTGAPRRRRRGGRGRRGGQGGQGGQGAHGHGHGHHGGAEGEHGGDAAAGGGHDAHESGADDGQQHDSDHPDHESDDHEHDGEGSASSRRRRRRRSRSTTDGDVRSPDDPPNTVVRIREPREHDDSGVQGVKGSTRLEAKKQRRREGREQGRSRGGRRGLVITESEFLARRESVDRVMAVRQRGDRTQIGVLEDGILVEHFVTTASTTRMVGNVYLGRVQNVLSGMEAAFVDIGKGRNAVLYAGEVNFDTSGLEGGPRRIESALKPGQAVVVQITKDPIGQKGARLTSQISLPGRYLVYVPEGSMMGISRKLPDVERSRLKAILKKVTPEGAGVIVRTAAEGASEEDLTRDVARLAAQWEDIKTKAETAEAPAQLYSEPDLTIRVIRDVFNEDFNSLVVQADTDWDTVEAYVAHVAPDLVPRLSRWTSEEDIFLQYHVDEQIAKALDRKVWLPSGGYLVIDRTEAMIVIDVNTGRFVGKGGNLEETVTKNNLEAAEEIVRQLRLRDIGGIIVIDFIDMVLEANRDLVLRRLVECLGRDRTKHQVAEVTSLGLVQMTRKRVGNGLLEAFSETCEACNGRGVIVHTDLVEHSHATRPQTPKPGPARTAASGGTAKTPSTRGKGSKARADAAAAASVDGASADVTSSDDGGQSSEGSSESTGVEDSGHDANADNVDGGTPSAGSPTAPRAGGASRSRRGGRRRGGAKVPAGAGSSASSGGGADSPAPDHVSANS